MKKFKQSFLFFCLVIICLKEQKSSAQQLKDSLSYYHNLYTKADKGTYLKKVYNFYNRYTEISLQRKDTLDAVYGYRFIASIENKYGQSHESDATATKALKLINKIKIISDTIIEAKIGLLNHLGIVSYELKNYDRALNLYNRALKIAQTKKQKNTIYNNKANAYKKKKKYALAVKEFIKVYSNSLKIGDSIAIARSLDNLGLVKSKLNHKDALKKMLDAEKIRKNINNINELFVSYKHLAEYFSDRKNKFMTKHYADKMYGIAVKTNNVSYKLEALAFLLDSDKNRKVLEYKRLIDSLNLVKQLNENKFTSVRYDYENEKRKADEIELELIQSQLEEEKTKRSKLIYQALAVFILILLISSYFVFMARYKKGKLEEIYNTEARISKKVHDEVANDVYHVMTKLETNTSVKEDVLEYLEGIYNKTRDISKENSTIDVDEDFGELLKDLLLSYKSESVNIITKNISSIHWKKVSNEKKTTIYRVLQELMTNMKKHSNASIVALTFHKKNKLIINYSDNGMGSMIKKQSGLQNAENRIKSASGTITFESELEKGFKATISI